MGARDFLDNQAARKDTVLPGRWLLDLEHDSTIVHVRRCTNPAPNHSFGQGPVAESSADAARRAAARLKEADALDVAWRAINAYSPAGGPADVREVLKTPCAIIVPASTRLGEVHAKELWMFDMNGSEEIQVDGQYIEALDGLQGIPPPVDSFPISDMLSCSLHGRGAGCTRDTTSGMRTSCRVSFRPGPHAYEWDLLRSSIVEKLSWRSGKRISMLSSPFGGASPLHATLSPYGHNHLLLHVGPSDPPRIRYPPTFRTLQPLNLPAHLVNLHSPTQEQLEHLEETFAAALGSSWASERPAWRMSQQALGLSVVEWGIFWVPLRAGQNLQSSETSPNAASPRTWASETAEGIMTIWPLHLVSGTPITAPESSTSSRKRKRGVPRVQAESSSSMLGIASGLFDFFSTYKEPPPPEEVLEDSSVEMVIPPVLAGNAEGAKGDDADAEGSDDDLFASRSPTPDDTISIAPNGDSADEVGHKSSHGPSRPQSPPRIVLDNDVDMDAPGSPIPIYSSKVSSVGMDDMNGVTEDDFDFFDGPAEEQPGEEETAGAQEPARQVKEDEKESGPDLLEVPIHVKDFAFANGPAHFDTIEDVPDVAPSPDPQAEALKAISDAEVAEVDSIPEPAPASGEDADGPDVIAIDNIVSSPILIDPSPKPSDISDMIPPDFSPLPLETIRLPSSLRPSTDAPPTVHALRSELLSRLKKQYNKHVKVDYHDGWKAHADASDEEAEDIGTEAATTPASSDMWDESTNQSGDEKEVAHGNADVEYDGVPCIGAEWFSAAGESGVMSLLKRRWKDAWGPVPELRYIVQEEHKQVVQDGMERAAREIVSNRLYRQSSPNDGSISVKHVLTNNGTTLGDFVSDTGISSLDTCTVHAGFAGNVMRLNASGLGFWRQLGLSPVGGEKDVSSVAICLPGDGNLQLADVLLKGVERAWAAMRLGKHVARAQSRVVISELQTIAGSLNLLIKSHLNEDLAIYIMLDRGRLDDPTLMSALSSMSPPPNQVVHIVPTDAIHAHEFAKIAMDVYNRVHRQLDPYVPDRLTPPPKKAAQWFAYPSFTLAPDTTPKPELILAWPLRSYDTLNRWRWLHVGYLVVSNAMVAFAIDAEGESWDVGVWVGADIGDLLERLWTFVVAFSAKVALEWRVAVVRLGVPSAGEMMALERLAESTTEPITTLFAEPSPSNSTRLKSRTPLPPANISNPMLTDSSSRLVDETLTTRITRLPHRLPVLIPSSSPGSQEEDTEREELYPSSSWTMTMATSSDDHLSSTYHLLSHRPALSKLDEVIEDVMAREYQKLTYLARLRFGWDDAGLPVHLQAVDAVARGLGLMLAE